MLNSISCCKSVNVFFVSSPSHQKWRFFSGILLTVSFFVLNFTNLNAQSFEKTILNIKVEDSAFEWLDADNDGDLDVLVFTYSSTYGPYFQLFKNQDGVFTIVADILTGDNDDYVYHNYKVGDYDVDGDIDFLIVKFGKLSVVINNGDLTFTLKEIGVERTSYAFTFLHWLDLDGDADLDIAFNGMMFMNSGDGDYLTSNISMPVGLNRLWWADLNNDGLSDLMATRNQYEENDGLMTFLNKGHGIFDEGAQIFAGFGSYGKLNWFDADQDGDLDLLVSNGSCKILRNLFSDTGVPMFENTLTLGSFTNPLAVITDADMNGLPDIIIHEDIDHLSSSNVYWNISTNGSLNFSKGETLASAERIFDMDVVDFNKDKKPDVFFGGLRNFDYFSGRMADVYSNILLPTTPSPDVPTNLQSVVQKNVTLSWHHNNDNKTCYYNIEITKDGQLYKSALTFADGTLRKPEIISLSASKEFTLYDLPEGMYTWRVESFDHAYRTSSFSSTSTFEIKAGPSNLTVENLSMTAAKLNWSYSGNGNPSFVVFRMTGNNAFEEIGTLPEGVKTFEDTNLATNEHFKYFVVAVSNDAYSTPSNTVSFYTTLFVEAPFNDQLPNVINGDGVSADFDLDGDYDFGFIGKTGGDNGNSGMFINDGVGNYSTTNFLPSGAYYSIVGKDFDNDGDTDIATIGQDGWRQRGMVFRNVNNSFTKVFETPSYVDMIQIATEDINNDGMPDLLLSGTAVDSVSSQKVCKLFFQSEDGGFADSQIQFPSGDDFAGKFHLSDLNNDGFIDITFSGIESTGARIFRNRSGHGFTEVPSSLPVLSNPFFYDLNGDSKIDILHRSYPITIYSGLGDFTFSNPVELNVEIGSDISVKSGDIDLNGRPDLIMTDGWRTRLMNNNGASDFVESFFQFPTIWGTAIFLTDSENDGDIDLIKFGDDYNDNAGINFFYRNQSTTITNKNNRPSAPSSIQVLSTIHGVSISWAPSNDDRTPIRWISYNLWLTDSNGKNWLHPETNSQGTFRRRFATGNIGYHTFVPINDLPAGEYTVRVQAIDAAFALSEWSEDVTFSIMKGPENLSIERIFLNKVRLHWTDGPLAENKTLILRRSATTDYEIIAEVPAGTQSYIDANVEYENIYTYKVVEAVGETLTASSNIVNWNTQLLILSSSNLPSFSGSLDVGDYTGDGKMDLLVLDEQTSAVFENSTTGWKKQNAGSTILPSTSSFKFQDINSDYRLDLYEYGDVDFREFRTEVFKNNGDKTFSPVTNVFSSSNYKLLNEWDYDIDNDLDAFVAVENRSGGQANIVLKNQNNGAYINGYTQCTACNDSYAFFGDFDNDGSEDIAEPYESGFGIFSNGFKGFQRKAFISQNFLISKGYPVDYNGDGWLDIFFRSSSYGNGKSAIYKNLGLNASNEIQFEIIKDDFIVAENWNHNWIDYDHDGDLDLIIAAPYQLLVYHNTGQDLKLRELPLKQNSYQLQLIDAENDGDIDLVVSGKGSDRKVFLNQLIVEGDGIKNLSPEQPTNLIAVQDSTGMYLNWSAGIDDHTVKSALTFDTILYREGKAITKGSINPETGTRLKLQPGRSSGTLYLKTLTPGQYTWKVQAVDQSYLGSALSVQGQFTFIPLQPSVGSDTILYNCNDRATITAIGENIEWFSDKELTEKIASGEFHPKVSQVVYVTQTVNGLRGFSKQVNITIYDRPIKPTILTENPLSFCEYEAGYNGYVEATGDEEYYGYIQWYDSPEKLKQLGGGRQLMIIAEEKNYYATQTIQGCESDAAEMKVYAEVIESTVHYEDGALITLEENGDYYEWYLNEDPLPNSNSYFISPNEYGAFTVGIIKGRCYEFSEPFILTAIEKDVQTDLKIFPNPIADNFTVEVPPTQNGNLQILDVSGKTLYKKELDNDSIKTITLSSAGWSSGVYFVVITNKQGKRSGMIIKR